MSYRYDDWYNEIVVTGSSTTEYNKNLKDFKKLLDSMGISKKDYLTKTSNYDKEFEVRFHKIEHYTLIRSATIILS